MINKIFLDSSILVEWTKGTVTDLFNHLKLASQYELCISHIVLSEYTFYLLIIEGGKAPVTLKRDKAISGVIQSHNPAQLLQTMTLLETGPAVIPLYLHYME